MRQIGVPNPGEASSSALTVRTKLPDGAGVPFGSLGTALEGLCAEELARMDGWEEVRPQHVRAGARLAEALAARGVWVNLG